MAETEHGPDCTCGVSVAATSRLLDSKALAEHLSVKIGTVSNAKARAEGRASGPAPSWWRSPDLRVGNADAWTVESAEQMRLARAAATT